MAEAINIECFYCREQGHSKRDCPIRKVDLEAKGLNFDQVYEEDRQSMLAKTFSKGHGHGVGAGRRNGRGQRGGGSGGHRGRSGYGYGGRRRRNDSSVGGRGRTATTLYGPVKQLAEAHYASVKRTGCLCNGHIATTCPRRPVPEVHMVEVFNSNGGAMCDEYTCHACDSDVKLSLLTVGVVHTCSLTGGFSATFAPILAYK